ncbi:MAG: dienelactone hydrolase family protein [Methylobacteriaceae bacterium]|nr:dienelactone hydrolase family protein [Methylobacteriaceae bacterium]
MRIAIILLSLIVGFAPARAEPVSIARGDGPALTGELLKPQGAGPFPAIVALHGCGGLRAADGRLARRHRDWAKRLVGAGFAVLFPDSFSARGLSDVCSTRERGVNARQRARDAAAAADFLAAQDFVDKRRIGLIGWSHGGSAALAATAFERPVVTDYKAAAIFYPGCRGFVGRGWTPRMKTILLHGVADDWTPIEPCEQLAGEAGVEIVRYADAHHGFDTPGVALRTRHAAYSKRGDGVVTFGTNEPARADAIARVMSLLRGM